MNSARRYVVPVYDPRKLVAGARYRHEDRKLTLWRKLWLLARHARWVGVERRFVRVLPGEPGYEEACYEAAEVRR